MAEVGINSHSVNVNYLNGLPYFFETDQPDQFDLSFDIFALIFYLISRYEEYGQHMVDNHGRYQSDQSSAVQNNFLHLPIVDLWIEQLRKLIIKKTGIALQSPSTFTICPTIDIDLPYAYRTKNSKNLLALIRDSFFMKWDKVQLRIDYLFHQKDPFDTYDYLTTSLEEFGSSVIFFCLCKYQRPYDENFLLQHPLFNKLVNKLSKSFTIGIHPSYSSNHQKEIISEEKSVLSRITGLPINQSRQHFLRLKFPDTYRSLIQCEIRHDHSMMYPDRIGFRASTCHPFSWYDIENECATHLRIYSPCIMDVTLKDYLSLSPTEAISLIIQMKNAVIHVNGHFEFIWHNSSFSALHGWEGWEDVYKELIKKD